MNTSKMVRRSITGVLLGSASFLACGQAVQAESIDATILADNGSLMVHQQGATYTVIPQSVAGNWPNPKTFNYAGIPDTQEALSQCKLHIISWGDGGVAQGMMAHIKGSAGVAFTGPGGILSNIAVSSVTHAPGAVAGQNFANNNVNAQAIILGAPAFAAPAFTSQAAISGGIPGTWGPVNLPAGIEGRDNVAFVWSEGKGNLNDKPHNYRVNTVACGRVVKPKAPEAHVASWEIAGQFNPTNNIAGATNGFEVWSYGYTEAANCSGPVILFRNKGFNPNVAGRPASYWSRGANGSANTNDLPMVGQSEGSTQLSPLRYAPQGLTMHPGPKGECAIVRFTAPEAGNYRLMGRFWAQNVTAGGTNVSTSVLKNTTFIDAAMTITAPSGSTNNPFNWSGALSQGEVIDFRVGANGSFLNDSTGLHGYIERITP